MKTASYPKIRLKEGKVLKITIVPPGQWILMAAVIFIGVCYMGLNYYVNIVRRDLYLHSLLALSSLVLLYVIGWFLVDAFGVEVVRTDGENLWLRPRNPYKAPVTWRGWGWHYLQTKISGMRVCEELDGERPAYSITFDYSGQGTATFGSGLSKEDAETVVAKLKDKLGS